MTNLEKYLKRPLTETERSAIEVLQPAMATIIKLGQEAKSIVHVIEATCVNRVCEWRRCPADKTCFDCWMEEYKGDN